jgi:hypothetical protein
MTAKTERAGRVARRERHQDADDVGDTETEAKSTKLGESLHGQAHLARVGQLVNAIEDSWEPCGHRLNLMVKSTLAQAAGQPA